MKTLEAASACVDIYSTDIAGDLTEVGASAARVEVAKEASSLSALLAFIDTLDESSEAPFSAMTKSFWSTSRIGI